MINLNCISDNKINKLLSSFNISLTREEIENIYFDAVLNKYHLESEYKMPYIEDIDEKVYSNKDYEESKKITAKHIELYNVIISKIEKLIPGLIKLKEQRLNEYIKLDKEIFN
jgi:hypothetical protein